MRRSTLLVCIALLALAANLAGCKSKSPPPPPAHDFSASARAIQGLGAADDPQLLQDPAYRRAWQDRRRRLYRDMYPDVGRVLQLTSAEERGFIELLVAQQLERIEQLSTPPDREIDGDAVARRSQELMLEQGHEMEQFLGSDRLQAWRQYEISRSWRQSVERLRDQIGGPDVLREDQVDELVRILRQAVAETSQPGPAPAGFPEFSDTSPEAMRARQAFAHQLIERRDARMLELAEPYLSARQLAAFDAILARHRFWQKPATQSSNH